jgi:hypothetical protein
MTDAAPSKLRSRLILLLIVTMFFGSFGIAAFLRFTGWKPAGSKNFGELLQPPKDLSALPLLRADGKTYAWAPDEERWQIVVVAPENCGAPCVKMMDTLHRVWVAPEFVAALPDVSRPNALPVYFVDPGGFLAMRYRPGFDPNGLRKDLARLLK